MPKKRLFPELTGKIAKKLSKTEKYIGEQISGRARNQTISSTAAQLLWAKQLGFGIANQLAKVSADVREEVRSPGSTPSALPVGLNRGTIASPAKRKTEAITASTIKSLLQDKELYARCKNLLRGKRHFDQVFREATTILDDRLKKKSGITNMNPENLVSKTLNPDPTKAVIVVSPEKAEQDGMHSVCKGIMLAFRNKVHHSLSDKFTLEDALKFCGFVDIVLGVIEQGTVHLDRVRQS